MVHWVRGEKGSGQLILVKRRDSCNLLHFNIFTIAQVGQMRGRRGGFRPVDAETCGGHLCWGAVSLSSSSSSGDAHHLKLLQMRRLLKFSPPPF